MIVIRADLPLHGKPPQEAGVHFAVSAKNRCDKRDNGDTG